MKRVILILETSIQAAHIQRFKVADYTHEELYMKFSQILDAHHTLHDICEQYCKDLLKSLRHQGCHCR